MKTTTARSLAVTADTLFVLLCAYVFYLAVQTQERLGTAYKETTDEVAARLQGIHPPKEVHRRNVSYPGLTGVGRVLSGVEPKAPEVASDVVEKPPEIKTPVADLVTVVLIQHGPPLSLAFIVPKTGARNLALDFQFQENEEVPFAQGAIVKRIMEDEVIFTLRGADETVALEAGTGGGGGDAGGSAKTGPSRPVSENPQSWVTYEEAKGTVSITPEGFRAISEKGEEVVLKDVRWATERLPDGKNAVRVEHVPQGSALARGGLQNGDVIHSINGQRVASKGEIIAYVRANPSLPSYTVVILRQGRRTTRTVTVPRGR